MNSSPFWSLSSNVVSLVSVSLYDSLDDTGDEDKRKNAAGSLDTHAGAIKSERFPGTTNHKCLKFKKKKNCTCLKMCYLTLEEYPGTKLSIHTGFKS